MTVATANILIVDDDPTIRLMVRVALSRQGYEVTEADNGRHGVEAFVRRPPDLILLDVTMPEMNGFDVVRAIRAQHEGAWIPILMLTSAEDVRSIDEAFDAGATDFMTKPINLTLLSRRVRYVLGAAERESVLRQARAEQESACRLARLGFWQLHQQSGAMHWSEEAHAVLGWREPLPDHLDHFLTMVDAGQRPEVKNQLELSMNHHEGLELEVRLGEGARQRILRMQGKPSADQDIMVGAFQDVTGLRALENQVLYLVEHDELTNLPKERLFLRLLQEQLDMVSGEDPWMVMVLDIDRLHRINDAFGHAAGDNVLRVFAQRLRQHADPGTLLCRLEADTFGVAMPMSLSHETYLSYLDKPHFISGKAVFVEFSAGAGIYPRDGSNAAELLGLARQAQRKARLGSGTKLAFHQQGRLENKAMGILLETDLRLAQDKDEFFMVFQPQQELSSSRIVGVEALIRWQHSQRGIISPAEFIPLLEESGRIQHVGDWIIEQACRQAAIWRRQGIYLRMGINLSARQFELEDLADRILACTERHGIPAQCLELEITENIAMHSPEDTIVTLKRLRDMGFNIAIDDFGTGYSSFGYLLRFPLTTLKIDRSFIENITEYRNSRAIIRSLTALSQGLGLKTIAEGVENQRQRDYLDALGINEIQGYLISRPVRADELQRCLALDSAADPDMVIA
ncbi:response regulator receiver/GGDEF/EAL domain-containing protein [Ectothiorhodospira sp. PHS-1]|uniref:putative bifunctional diguanylate cyclase/phosphodiesterase n=1 Tax=Ectothiorhodospira sp. PHS-1 TaxID=519989 RepID=UPI00024A8558|nr:EAL domain-containing protein [Ectothiorhodospira sp. PHS-1]EHQ51697.1 response regulator receiver/GGDEF/EAL domain-containing protein [Ectothiorhodospira sp. PHS-1]